MIQDPFSQVYQDILDRSAYRRAWNLCMMPADVAAFSTALKAAFPSIRFVSREYWRRFWDDERIEADNRENERRRKLDLPRRRFCSHMRDPTGEPLRYWGSLADPAETRFIAWIEPPGWQPVWTPPEESGTRYIENPPRLWFDFYRSHFILERPPYRQEAEPHPLNGRETIKLEGHTFEVRWNPQEPEAEAFAKKVYNILRKLTVDRFIRIDRESRRAFARETQGMRKQCLAGRHAIAWAMKRRHNYISCENDGWAMLKPAHYPFRRGDVFTPGEYKRWLADNEAEREAFVEARVEESKRRARERAKSGAPATLDIIVTGSGALSGLDMRIPIAEIPPRSKRKKG